jgi:hypothetical protein
MGKWNRLGSDDAVGTGPNPQRVQELGPRHSEGPVPMSEGLTEEMTSMIRTKQGRRRRRAVASYLCWAKRVAVSRGESARGA